MPASLEILVEIPSPSLLTRGASSPEASIDQMALRVEKLVYQPGAADIWNLPAEQPVINGVLMRDGPLPQMRCTIPLPQPGETTLYRVVVLKTGTVLDTRGKIRAEQLLATEEELLFIQIGGSAGHPASPEAYQRVVAGIQCVVVPVSDQ